ncbi:MAG: tRNA (adenosine(37)-N6)-threonylcarbamoyltransferase complex dimerization subunit type 1 TsaB [Rhizobiaceae bacterium]
MLRLIIETSNLDFQLALHTSGQNGSQGGFAYRSDKDAAGTPSELTEMLTAGLAQADRSIAEIDEIVVDLGPGGLTSTRSGIAFANGLAFARNIKIVGANSLELMVLQIARDPNDHVIAARRSNDGNYFLGFFQGGICHKLALGKPMELIHGLGWQNEEPTWVGPHPKNWVDEPPALNVEFIDLLSPGLEAFDNLMATPEFAGRPRLDAAGPMNETIR